MTENIEDADSTIESIQLILSDVDGVLTDGTIEYNANGIETKRFNVQDGLGIKLWLKAGFQFGIVTGRTSDIVSLRAKELGISIIYQGVTNKQSVLEEIAGKLNLTLEQICFIGDDLPDLAPICNVAFGATVPAAPAELLDAADYITSQHGGNGAVRELIETILRQKGLWDDIVNSYV